MEQNKASHVTMVQSLSSDPYYNLALEAFLFDQILPGQVILYLWQNQSTVVIGKNQNPWRECDWQTLQKEGGKLARRLTGGGAVYHDLGNLNFSFIMNQAVYNEDRQLGFIISALQDLGIPAEFSGRNDLEVEGRKFSGNAFYGKGDTALHHGTILIHTDLDKMAQYLHPSQAKLNSKGIESVRSRVVNLTDYNADLTAQRLGEKIRERFVKFYGNPIEDLKMDHFVGDMEQRYQEYSSWDWCFGESPDFDLCFEEKFSWGSVELGLYIQNGVISKAFLYSDAMNPSLLEAISGVLQETSDKKSLIRNLDNVKENELDSTIFNELKQWLVEKIRLLN